MEKRLGLSHADVLAEGEEWLDGLRSAACWQREMTEKDELIVKKDKEICDLKKLLKIKTEQGICLAQELHQMTLQLVEVSNDSNNKMVDLMKDKKYLEDKLRTL